MAKENLCWCDLCGTDFKSKSPFATMCPVCKGKRFTKPGPESKGNRQEVAVSTVQLIAATQRISVVSFR